MARIRLQGYKQIEYSELGDEEAKQQAVEAQTGWQGEMRVNDRLKRAVHYFLVRDVPEEDLLSASGPIAVFRSICEGNGWTRGPMIEEATND